MADPATITSRRTMLGVLAVAPLVAGAAAAAPRVAPSAFTIALHATKEADRRFEALPGDLETRDPAAYAAEEDRLLKAYSDFTVAVPATLEEFVVKFAELSDGGTNAVTEWQTGVLLADARRLLR